MDAFCLLAMRILFIDVKSGNVDQSVDAAGSRQYTIALKAARLPASLSVSHF